MNRETLGAYAAGLIAKGWTPTREDLAEFAQADVVSPRDAFEIGQLDAIAKAARWVLESNLSKLGYVRIPGEAKAKSGKGGNLVLARKGSELRDKAEKLGLNKKADSAAVDEDSEKLKNLKAKRFKTHADESSIKRLEARVAADPKKWREGDGVGHRVYSSGRTEQINRGFRVVRVDNEKKQALIRQVRDTGLTSTGGNYDKIGDQWVHVADLVRNRRDDAPGNGKAAKDVPPAQLRTNDKPGQAAQIGERQATHAGAEPNRVSTKGDEGVVSAIVSSVGHKITPEYRDVVIAEVGRLVGMPERERTAAVDIAGEVLKKHKKNRKEPPFDAELTYAAGMLIRGYEKKKEDAEREASRKKSAADRAARNRQVRESPEHATAYSNIKRFLDDGGHFRVLDPTRGSVLGGGAHIDLDKRFFEFDDANQIIYQKRGRKKYSYEPGEVIRMGANL